MNKIEINKLGMNGEGIGKINGKVCFIKHVLPEEVVSVKIKEEKKDYIVGELIGLEKKSCNRVEPCCPYYTSCGGCDLQHLKYEKQLEFKQNLIEETFEKISGLKIKVDKIYYDNQFEYRNKSVFAVKDEDGTIKVGMKQENSNTIIEINNCLLQNNLSIKILNIFKKFLIDYKINCKGVDKQGVKYLVIRIIDNKALVTIVSDVYDNKIQYFSKYLDKEKIEYGIYLNINKNKKNILSKQSIHLSGLKNLASQINNIKYYISPNSFLQVNTNIQNLLYNKVLEELHEEVVIDCYSGAGLMSALLSKKAKKVYGIEIEKSASYDANILKQKNNLTNLININGDTAKELPKVIKKNKKNVCVVLDPPRNGCDKKVLKLLCDTKPNQIIYISCLPRTLARDMNVLKEEYNIVSVNAFEMFPNTKHIETLVCLQRKDGDKSE